MKFLRHLVMESNLGEGGGGGTGSGTPAASPPAGGSGTGTPAAGGGTASWRDSLPEAMRSEASIQNFNSVEDLAKSYVHAQVLIGRDKIPVPTDKSTDEEWSNFYAKAGRPESPEKYGLKIDGLSESAHKELSDTAFKLGLSPKQLAGLAQWSDKNNKSAMENHQTQVKVARQEAKESYIKELGGDDKFKITFDKAKQAVNMLADDGFKKYLVDSGLGADPKFIKFFAKLADRMKEDGIKGDGGTQFNDGLSQIEEKIRMLEANPALWEMNHDGQSALSKQRSELLMLKARLMQK